MPATPLPPLLPQPSDYFSPFFSVSLSLLFLSLSPLSGPLCSGDDGIKGSSIIRLPTTITTPPQPLDSPPQESSNFFHSLPPHLSASTASSTSLYHRITSPRSFCKQAQPDLEELQFQLCGIFYHDLYISLFILFIILC